MQWYHIHITKENGQEIIDSVKINNEAQLVGILLDYVNQGATITNIVNAPIELYEQKPLTADDMDEMAALFGGEQ
tara:strand:- start:119 stop:343 length:225 start_codon:yes stop_codon:yes gene_type:complete